MNPTISIVTGTKNRQASYVRLCRSISAVMKVPFEFFVADASNPGYATTNDIQNDQLLWTTVIRESPPLGHIRGYNTAFSKCRGEFVLWVNDDAELLPGWDDTALRFMGGHPEIAVGALYFRDRTNGDWKTYFEVQSLFDIQYANFGFVRREAGVALDWFDPSLGMTYCADTDFCFRAICQGFGVAPMFGCGLLHYREMDAGRKQNEMGRKEDRNEFNRKWDTRVPELKAQFEKFKRFRRAMYIPAEEW